jgi:hypothetical protein
MSFGHLVGAKAECNWYLRDINIFTLLIKNGHWYSALVHLLMVAARNIGCLNKRGLRQHIGRVW